MTRSAHNLGTAGGAFDAGRLCDFVVEAFLASGATAADARTAAEVLVRTDMRGTHSHGTQTLPIHLENLERGGTRSPAEIETVRSSAVSAVLDGHGGIGLVVATETNRRAIEMARRSGIAIVLVRGSNHFGAAGHYALAAADAGFIGIATSNASPIMTAAGSRKKVISNAPFAYAVPTSDGAVCLDIAMSATAGMKVRTAAAAGLPIPEGWIIDGDGHDTTDPGDYARGGALLPMAGHKGYGLAVLVEVLAGVLSGAHMLSGVVPWLVRTDTPTEAGHAFIVIDPDQFLDRAEFTERIDGMVAEIAASPPVPGVTEVLLPGELERRAERRARSDGIPLPATTVARLEEAAAHHGLQSSLAAAGSARTADTTHT